MNYYVYILSNRSRTLYTGITDNLLRRIFEHKNGLVKGFTKKYRIPRLVWYKEFSDVRDAITCEKRIKGWLRKKKIALIESKNPTWRDLSEDWYGDSSSRTIGTQNDRQTYCACTKEKIAYSYHAAMDNKQNLQGMYFKRIIALIILLLALTIGIGQTQDVFLRLTDYAGSKTNIVVMPFAVAGSPELQTKIRNIETIIKADLDYSLYFNVLPDTTGLIASSTKSGIVVKGTSNGTQLDIALEDFESHSAISNLNLKLEGDTRTISHSIADEITLILTGEKGIASTKIVFSYKKGKGKELAITDYDGYNFSSLTNNGNLNLFPCWAPDGKRVLFSNYNVDRLSLYLIELARKKTSSISTFHGLNFAPDWAPDGTKLALTLTKDGNAEIYILDLETKALNRLTNNWSIDCSPVFSPNSRELAFVSDRSGGPQVYFMDIHGGNVRRLTFHGDYNTSPAWSPRGDLVCYVSRETDNSQQIYVTDPNDFQPIRLTYEGNNEEPSWSPDGLHVVFCSNRSGRYELHTMNWDGTRQRKITSGLIAGGSDWSPFLK